MIIYISGGCKNGKSSLAEDLAVRLAGQGSIQAGTPAAHRGTPAARGRGTADAGSLYYIATMIPHDEEDEMRIARHIESRKGKGFTTVERGLDMAGLALASGLDRNGTYLLDSVTAILSNEMFRDGLMDPDAPGRVAEGLGLLSRQVRHIVMVSDFIFSDQGLYDQWTETYQKGLASVDKAMAAIADTVVEVVLGQTVIYKGSLEL